MDQNRPIGTVRNIAGKVEQGVGQVAGDAKMQAEGLIDQAAGAAQDAYGKTVDAAMDGAQKVKDVAVEGHDLLRKFIENNPHTAAAVALGIGLLIGYTAHRPPEPRRYW
jgi:uncharacterized protein YjbJ (UPF0337 family)